MSEAVSSGVAAVFLDRDGTLIVDKGYLRDPAEIELLPGVVERLRRIQARGYLLVMVTNQSGIGRGYFTEEDLKAQHVRLGMLLAEAGVVLAAMEHCPHQPEDRCSCRKPKPGMLLRAAERHGIDLERSYMVGDKPSDVDAGAAAGCKTVLIADDPIEEGQKLADHVAASAAAALDWVLEETESIVGT
ncbi:MAG: HAD family hydrolase [Verrucomicrobiota bacterium]|jgi:D-glycero-D-manno-heptose 1,7-bisphosphate phosphatase|nr:HAD family hydrolase [Verrucomicrobiota bacterium]MDI9384540.1 HAD family hydrolase [Verrucomicrobiota bacterium]